MTYTQARPPVLKANLGTLAAAPTCTVVDHTGATIQAGAMTKITNTTIWYFAVTGSLLSVSTAEYAYYITDTSSNVLEEGTFSVEDSTTSMLGAIATKDFDCPSVIGTPAQYSATKIYTIRFRPAAQDGTFLTGVTAIGGSSVPAINIHFKDSANAATYDVTASMTLNTNIWEYDWSIVYATPADLVKITISCQHSGKTYTFVRHAEIVKPKEFNPQRLSVGTVG